MGALFKKRIIDRYTSSISFCGNFDVTNVASPGPTGKRLRKKLHIANDGTKKNILIFVEKDGWKDNPMQFTYRESAKCYDPGLWLNFSRPPYRAPYYYSPIR